MERDSKSSHRKDAAAKEYSFTEFSRKVESTKPRMRYTVTLTLWDTVYENAIKGSFIHSFIHSQKQPTLISFVKGDL